MSFHRQSLDSGETGPGAGLRVRFGDSATDWLFNGMGEAFDNNTARMAIAGDDPMLLSQMDPDKVSRANKAMAKAYKPARERIT